MCIPFDRLGLVRFGFGGAKKKAVHMLKFRNYDNKKVRIDQIFENSTKVCCS